MKINRTLCLSPILAMSYYIALW